MLSFLEILKKLHRLSIHDYFFTKKFIFEEQYIFPYGHTINENLLYSKLKVNEKSKNNFRFILELNKLELVNDYDIEINSNVNIEILSRNIKKRNNIDNKDINTNKLNLFNILMNNAHKYENNFILKSQKITSLKSDDNDNSKENFNICFSNEIRLDKYYFNKNKKIIYLDKLRIDEKEINFEKGGEAYVCYNRYK